MILNQQVQPVHKKRKKLEKKMKENTFINQLLDFLFEHQKYRD